MTLFLAHEAFGTSKTIFGDGTYAQSAGTLGAIAQVPLPEAIALNGLPLSHESNAKNK
jgi:hypothetical protein